MQEDCAVMNACACLAFYNGICLILNVLACPAMHLCVTLGKKARLHLMFSLAKAKKNPAISIRCLSQGVLKLTATHQNIYIYIHIAPELHLFFIQNQSFITSYSNANT